jgi:hypothetical protein
MHPETIERMGAERRRDLLSAAASRRRAGLSGGMSRFLSAAGLRLLLALVPDGPKGATGIRGRPPLTLVAPSHNPRASGEGPGSSDVIAARALRRMP